MKIMTRFCIVPVLAFTSQAMALALGPDEFHASREMACVLAKQSLGQLSENEYGAKSHALMDGFDESERDNILAQAVGFYGGLMFSVPKGDSTIRLKNFLSSTICSADYRQVTLPL
ncbi:MAG: hypothetical protein ACKVKR_13430 [Pseudomonadales bacterium]|jgi:hypothetical protein|tara:strand:+ start:798 stop:1145 length:348 start_codon:yes stop_codon:yes gene_type:complete